MSKLFILTNAQKTVLRGLARGLTLKKCGYGYEFVDSDGRYVAKASIAVKTLRGIGLVGYIGEPRTAPLYFTTRGYHHWFGGAPMDGRATLCKLADEDAEQYMRALEDAS